MDPWTLYNNVCSVEAISSNLRIYYNYFGDEPSRGEHEAIGHQLPEVLDGQVVHFVIRFDRVELPVTAVARHHHHVGAGGPNLIHFTAGVVDPLVVKAGHQSTTTATAANLIIRGGVKVHPVLYTLAEYPARLLKKAMAKALLGPPTVVAGVMVGHSPGETVWIDFDTTGFKIFNQEIEHRNKIKLIKRLRKMFFETRPGR